MLTAADALLASKVTEFWSKVQRGGPDECWLWRGYIEDGYGRFHVAGRMYGAHELAVTFTTGERRAEDLDTCHSCHTPICVNPRHLRFDTRLSNVADMDAAGRRRQGATKLSEDQVRVIRTRLAKGAKIQALADEYGVSNSMISMIRTGRRYAHVG